MCHLNLITLVNKTNYILYIHTLFAGVNFDSSKPDWNIRTMAKLLSVKNWAFVVWTHLEWVLLPLLAGLATTAFCWAVLYLNSNIPGRDPPLPCSNKRWRERSGHNFHLQYSMTLYLGVLVTVKMIYDRWGMAVLA